MRAEAPEVADDRWLATVAAAVLRRGSMVHAASLTLTLAALLACAAGSIFAATTDLGWLSIGCAMVVLGIVEFWLAARVALDADLFDAMAAREADLDGLDRAMLELGLMPQLKTRRPLNTRIRGALRLLKLQALTLGLQVGVLVVGMLSA